MDLESMNDLYPPVNDFVTALQDEGTMTKKKDDTKLVYKKINAISNELHKKLLKLDITGYPKNVSKGSEIITSSIIQCHKQVDVVSVCVELRIFAPSNLPTMYIVSNDKHTAGFELILRKIDEFLKQKAVRANDHCTPNDGLHVAGILCDIKYRDTVIGVLAGRADRQKLDLPVNPTIAFAEDAVADFLMIFIILFQTRVVVNRLLELKIWIRMILQELPKIVMHCGS
jgi:hypothetical protein